MIQAVGVIELKSIAKGVEAADAGVVHIRPPANNAVVYHRIISTECINDLFADSVAVLLLCGLLKLVPLINEIVAVDILLKSDKVDGTRHYNTLGKCEIFSARNVLFGELLDNVIRYLEIRIFVFVVADNDLTAVCVNYVSLIKIGILLYSFEILLCCCKNGS